MPRSTSQEQRLENKLVSDPNHPLDQTRELSLDDNTLRAWYAAAETIANVRIEQYKALGLLSRSEQITNEEEQDDHFDDLQRIHRQSCAELGLPWPPPSMEEQQDTETHSPLRSDLHRDSASRESPEWVG